MKINKNILFLFFMKGKFKMIILNSSLISQEQFGDGTLKCVLPDNEKIRNSNSIRWCYDNDGELFTLWSLMGYLHENYPDVLFDLELPYIPNARQDRNVSNRIFTLKYFAKLINEMNFSSVFVVDPHSDVSTALLDRVHVRFPNTSAINGLIESCDAIMYPDAGAAKKYSSICAYKKPIIIGNKHRDENGRIADYELLNFNEGIKTVLIRDDICSYGGTFVAAANELRNRGVEKIYLFISHCENNILKGDVLKTINRVFTTDSIYTAENPNIEVIEKFRRYNEY